MPQPEPAPPSRACGRRRTRASRAGSESHAVGSGGARSSGKHLAASPNGSSISSIRSRATPCSSSRPARATRGFSRPSASVPPVGSSPATSRRRWWPRRSVGPSELGLSNVEFLAQDAQALELADASVDGVLCRWGYMLVPEPSVGALGDGARPPTRRTRRVRRLGECRRESVGVGGRTRAGGAGRDRSARNRTLPGRSGWPTRSEYAASWRTPVSSFSRRRTSRSRGGTEASTSSGRRRSIFRARWRRRSQHSTRTTPTTSARTFAERVEPYVDGGELVLPASESSHARSPRLALR